MSQKFIAKEEIGKLLQNGKLAGITNNFLIDKMEDQKLKKLIKTYNRPKTCQNLLILKRNEEIWRNDLIRC